MFITRTLFIILNNFTYHNFVNFHLPIDEIQKRGLGIQWYGFLKVWMLVASPIVQLFVDFFDACKTIRF